jgi:predicted enzyme related to lactoylglutathione lyase
VNESPVFRAAGISYLHIPARDPEQSATFYRAVFGWTVGGSAEQPASKTAPAMSSDIG